MICLALPLIALTTLAKPRPVTTTGSQQSPFWAKQLFAVRGEIVKIKTQSKGLLLITVKPAKEYAEVTVLAHENDLVGSAVRRGGRVDVLGLLADDGRTDEIITAAELNEGDEVSVIYDPQQQNRGLEIYLR